MNPQAAVYGQDSWSREEISSEVQEGKKGGGGVSRGRPRDRSMLGGPEFLACPLLLELLSLPLINHPQCTPLPPYYPIASQASAVMLWRVGSLEAPQLENLFRERVRARRGRVEESGRG